jgi:hypothetical protein
LLDSRSESGSDLECGVSIDAPASVVVLCAQPDEKKDFRKFAGLR